MSTGYQSVSCIAVCIRMVLSNSRRIQALATHATRPRHLALAPTRYRYRQPGGLVTISVPYWTYFLHAASGVVSCMISPLPCMRHWPSASGLLTEALVSLSGTLTWRGSPLAFVAREGSRRSLPPPPPLPMPASPSGSRRHPHPRPSGQQIWPSDLRSSLPPSGFLRGSRHPLPLVAGTHTTIVRILCMPSDFGR